MLLCVCVIHAETRNLERQRTPNFESFNQSRWGFMSVVVKYRLEKSSTTTTSYACPAERVPPKQRRFPESCCRAINLHADSGLQPDYLNLTPKIKQLRVYVKAILDAEWHSLNLKMKNACFSVPPTKFRYFQYLLARINVATERLWKSMPTSETFMYESSTCQDILKSVRSPNHLVFAAKSNQEEGVRNSQLFLSAFPWSTERTQNFEACRSDS